MFAYGRRYLSERTAIDLCYALPNLEVIDYSADTEGPPQVYEDKSPIRCCPNERPATY